MIRLLVLGTVAMTCVSYALSAPPEQFSSLSESKQAEVIAESFKTRLSLSQNVHYIAETTFTLREFHNGVVGKAQKGAGSSTRIERWQNGGSYRIDTRRKNGDAEDTPEEHISAAFDAIAGVARVSHRPVAQRAGKIDTRQSPSAQLDRYSYWFDGERNAFADYPFRYFADHRSHIKVTSAATGLAEVSAPWKPFGFTIGEGARSMVLDPARDFLPVRGQADWSAPPSSRVESFQVNGAINVSGVWVPTEIREVVSAGHVEGRAAVYDIYVIAVDFGNVTDENLAIKFPPGTEVHDVLKGVRYTVDDQELP